EGVGEDASIQGGAEGGVRPGYRGARDDDRPRLQPPLRGLPPRRRHPGGPGADPEDGPPRPRQGLPPGRYRPRKARPDKARPGEEDRKAPLKLYLRDASTKAWKREIGFWSS